MNVTWYVDALAWPQWAPRDTWILSACPPLPLLLWCMEGLWTAPLARCGPHGPSPATTLLDGLVEG